MVKRTEQAKNTSSSFKRLENDHINRLVEKAQNGDNAAFTELVRIFNPRVHYIIKRYVREQVEAADVAQEVFLKVHKYLKGFKGESSFYTWLYSVTTSVAKNHLMALKRSQLITSVDSSFTDYMEFAVDVHENLDPQDILVSDETENTLIETIENLPQILKEVIILRELEGLSYIKISDLLKIPEGTVRSRIHRARSIIEQNLGDTGTNLIQHSPKPF